MFKNESSVVIALIFMNTYIFDKTKMTIETFNIQMDATHISFFYLILFIQSSWVFFTCISLNFFFPFHFRTIPESYGNSQARGPTGAVTAGPHHSHSNVESEPLLWPTPHSLQLGILNPLSEARDWAHITMDTSPVHYCWAAAGTPLIVNVLH